jgi:hypothetical protein
LAKSKLVLFIFFSFSVISHAEPINPHEGEAFIFYLENDSKNVGGPGSDQAYSNGFKFSYIYAEDRAPKWPATMMKGLKLFDDQLETAKTNFGFSLGHQIYTPNKTHIKELITDDRPYAGWLYLGLAVSFRNEKTAHFFEVDVGTIGPSAQGQQVQNNFHDFIKEPRAEGWENSLHDEPTLELLYQKRFKLIRSHPMDAVAYYGTALGNVQIGAHTGGIIRLGHNLPDDFGPGRPSAGDGDSFVTPSTKSDDPGNSYYAFAGIRGNAIAKNIFLDGNTFRSSHHVKKYPFTFDTEFGFGLEVQPYGIVWRFVTRSPEFEQRSIFNSFASMNFTYFF